jgi:hypothetical protein
VEPHIIISFTDFKLFFNLDILKPAPGRPVEVKALKILKLDVLEQASGCPNKKIRSLPLKMALQIPKNALLHEIPPPLELN